MTVATTDPMRPHLYAIRQVRSETDDTFTMELAPAKGTSLAPFGAGQFNMVYVPAVGEVPISISGDPGTPSRLLHTTRAVGGVTNAMRQLRRGDLLGIRGPFGVGWPIREAAGKDVVLVAGGIGLAPLRPVLYSLLAERDHYDKIVLLYGTRTPSDILFRKELEAWRARLDIEVYATVDRAMGRWHGNVGVVTNLIPKAPFDRTKAIAMICGPEVMMRFTAIKLEERGVPPTSIYLSMERNMKCGIGLCGHCQYGPTFVCKDGPVYRYDRIKPLLATREV
ncbi:MAG TPA: FAD/NAD(P)-binding protein [Vicinamibacterales bacterium]